MNFYSADPHFDRGNMLSVTKRPFPTVELMNRKILEGYQRRVKDTDDLFLLGDLVHKTSPAEDARRWFDQIPGRKHLIIGNHDKSAVTDLPWHSVQHYLEIEDNGRLLVLFHYPMITWNHARAGSLHLFGHVHQNWAGSRLAVNVGVDFWDFAPCTLPEIEARAATLPPPPHWDVVEPGS